MIAFAHQSNIIPFPTCEPEKQKSNEWYTPSRYIEAARRVMGKIDLDPASCEVANRTVRATRFYSKEENGLAQKWYGNVWLNPPFGRQNASQTTRFGGGKSIMGMFIARLLSEYQSGNIQQAIALVTTKPDASWFAPLWEYLICFATHRIIFSRVDDIPQGHFYGTCFVYLGPNEAAFIREFSQFGTIAKAIAGPRRETVQASLWTGGQS